MTFAVKSQGDRRTTKVTFYYWGDQSLDTMYLLSAIDGNFQPIALVTTPLLATLNWQRISYDQPQFSLFQRNGTYDSIDAFKANLPPANTLVADNIMAKLWHLRPDQYTDIDNISSLDGYNYVLTTYLPQQKDGAWNVFSEVFDLTNSTIDANGNLNWQLYRPVGPQTKPFYLGTVHVDYQTVSIP